MKLFTIGDSISQGFMSNAAARTDQCYSTLIAEILGIPSNDYHYINWSAGGLPCNLEHLMRSLEKRYKDDISGFEWATALLTVDSVFNEAEEYYERGLGNHLLPIQDDFNFLHNVAIQGFNVADSWLVKPEICLDNINKKNTSSRDNFLGGPSEPFYRVALKVLDPRAQYSTNSINNFSQLDWLKYHMHSDDQGIENIIIWLGANNILGTTINLEIIETPNNPANRPHTLTHDQRTAEKWNLWIPDDFRAEYESFMFEQLIPILQLNPNPDWKAFVGTIPFVTIVPLIKGVGKEFDTPDGIYYKYYTYFPFEEQFALETGKHLTCDEARYIDNCTKKYNAIISQVVNTANLHIGKDRLFLVDLGDAFNRMAWKRNRGLPTYEFPPYLDSMYPQVNTKYYHVNKDAKLKQGGIFSLDGMHPTAIGQGLLAHEFLQVMEKQGVRNVHNLVVNSSMLNWREIVKSDSLYTSPIKLMHEVYEHDKFAEYLVNIVKMVKEKRLTPA